METETGLIKQDAQPLMLGDILKAVVDKGVTEQNMAAVEKLCALIERREARDAEKAFAEAFVRLQTEIPRVQATKSVPNNDGSVRYTFAPFEEVDAQARPICLKNGFSYWFAESSNQTPGKLTKTCWLQHVGGHKRSNDYSVRIGKGPPGCSESQADGAAHSYAKRGALCDALSIVVRGQDNDARLEGGSITSAQAASLQQRIIDTKSDMKAFLKVAGADSITAIPETNYAMLDALLKRKEAKT